MKDICKCFYERHPLFFSSYWASFQRQYFISDTSYMFSAIYLSRKQKNRLNFFFIHFVWKQELLNARINTLRFHGAWFRKWSSIRNTEKNAHREEPKKSIGITVALNDDNDNKDDCRHLSVVCVAAKNELWPVQRTRVRKRERERVCVESMQNA